jgi:hypothetical protein
MEIDTLNDLTAIVSSGDVVMFSSSGRFYAAGWDPDSNVVYIDSAWNADNSRIGGGAIITGADTISGTWVDTSVGGNTLYKIGYEAIHLDDFDNTLWTLTENDSLMDWQSSLGAVDAPGDFYFGYESGTTDTFWVYPYSGNPNTNTMIVGDTMIMDMAQDNSHSEFYGLTFEYGSRIIIRVGYNMPHPDSCVWSHCTFRYVSGESLENTTLIGARTGGGTDTSQYGHGHVLRACSLYACIDADNPWAHNKMTSWYSVMYCVVESCLVQGGGIGINFKGQDGGGYMVGNVVKFNTVVGSGNGINMTSWHWHDSVFGNIVYMTSDWFTARDRYKDGADIYNCQGITWGGTGTTGPCFCANNTMWNVDKPLVCSENTLDGLVTFRWNICDSTPPGGEHKAFIVQSGDLPDIDPNYNVYHDDSWSWYVGTNGYTWSQWQGFEKDTNSLRTDPVLNDPANGDMEPTDTTGLGIDTTYSGYDWSLWGAVQPEEPPSDTSEVEVKGAIPMPGVKIGEEVIRND